MKLTNHQFIEAAFIFEKENGNRHGKYEKEVIKESNLLHLKPSELKTIIINGLNLGLYTKNTERTSAYWALSKTNDKNIIPEFKNWLKKEFNLKNETPIFQLLIALDRFDESAFDEKRNSRYFDETELNFRDAKNYLENN